MNIKSIRIKNVRGLQDHTVELGLMYPNKPSLMVAPNGSGKSSFALAFQWLNQRRIKLNKDDAYNGDETNSPELIITTDEPSRNVYKASADQNQISPRFGIFVINSDLKVKSPGYAGGVPLGKTSLSVSPIILLENKPDNVDIINDFYEHFGISNPPVGLYPSINVLLANNDFMASFNANNLSAIKRPLKQIEEFIERMKTYKGTISTIHKQIEESDLTNLKATTCVKNMMDAIKEVNTGDNDTKLMLKAIQIITLYKRNEDNFKRRIAYSQYMKKTQSLRDFFHTVPTTWKGITPHEENGTFKNRKQLLKVAKLGPKAFEQCAGFLRVSGGDEPLDATGVHPETYKETGMLLKNLGYSTKELSKEGFRGISKKITDYKKLSEELGIGEITLKDIVKELEKPGRDPREDLPKPILRTDVLEMKDLKPGMKLKGTVRNVIDFGAFVDIGVHQDGLVHISQMADRFIKHPLEVVSVGDVVDVTVISVDMDKKRIQLSMKNCDLRQ